MLDLRTAVFIINSLCLRHQGTALLPSLGKGCAPIDPSCE
jgi:hypothetical protein